jgi:DNA-directed RNA polymerase subunit D
MAMEMIEKKNEKVVFVTDMTTSLANAIRRSASEIPILAIEEADIYKNDTALYDEIIAHRLGLIPLKNQKVKEGESVELKLKAKGKGERTEVLSGALGEEVVYPGMPIVLLEEGQELEIVARAKSGKGKDHARYSPGLVFYKHLPKIKISSDGEKQTELAELYPQAFEEVNGKLKLKDATKCDLDEEDLKDYPGITIEFKDDLVFSIESWGQIDAKEIFNGACKALKANLAEVSKAIK